jgi:HEAT repeat protein
MSNEFEEFINSNLDAFDNRVPDPAVLNRIHEQMRGMKKKQGILVPIRVVRWAAACVMLLAGAATFWVLQNKPKAGTIATVTPGKTLPVAPPDTERSATASLPDDPSDKKTSTGIYRAEHRKNAGTTGQELSLYKQALFAKLNNMESPSQRITAAAGAYELKNTDKDIVDALVKTMNGDPNTNVRLAALEALSRFHRESYVKKQLIASLKKQKDPMVQIELIQLLTRMKETTILQELDKIVNDENTIKAVKDHAYSGIFTLRS